MFRLLSIFLLTGALLSDTAAADGIPARPDVGTIRKIQSTFKDWTLNSSGRCAVAGNGLWAWKVVLEHPIDPSIKSSASRNGKGYIIVVLVPDAGIDPGPKFIELFDWSIPGSDLKQYTVFLGRGNGYYWYVKSDIGRLNLLRKAMRISGGVNMDRLMADALNVQDYGNYTSHIAADYFRGRGAEVVPLILESARLWQLEEKEPPVQHLAALKWTGSAEAGKALVRFASSRNTKLAHQALRLLVEEPYLASDNFYRRALSVPEYTGSIIGIFRTRNKPEMILPRLRELVQAPRTIRQYVEVLGALREFEAGKKFKSIPEFDAVNDIMYLMMRMGETPDTIQYVPIEAQGAGSPSKLAEEERKRIEPHLEKLRKSRDHETVFAAALALASFSPPRKLIADTYTSRVRKVGVEILRMLPPELVISRMNMLSRSLKEPKELAILRMIQQEYGGR